jgi:hypothetical protein
MTIVSHALLIIVANGCLFAAGAGLTRAVGAWSHPRELRHALGISLIGGIAAYGVAAELLYVLGLSLRLWQALALCTALAATGLLGGRGPGRSPSPRPFARLEIVPAALAGLMLFLLGLESIFQSLASWDAWAMWTPKARALVVLNGLDPHVFANVAYRSWHLDYPLLVPAVEAYAFRFIGIDYRVIHFEQWFLLLGFALAFVDLLRPRVRPVFMWGGLLAILWAPKIGSEMLTANADLPLALFVGLAGITAFIWMTEASTGSLGLLVLFAAAAMATKVEGTYLVVILFALTIVYVARRSRRQMWLTVAAGAVATVGIVPWRIWVSIHHLPASYSVILVVLGELFSPRAWLLLMPLSLLSVAVLARTGLQYRRGPLLAAVTAVLLVVGIVNSLAIPGPSFPYPWRSSDSILLVLLLVAGALFVMTVTQARGPAAWALGTAAAMTGSFITVYVVTPHPFQWLLGTSSSRVILGPALLLAALVPLLLERAAVNARTPPDTTLSPVAPHHI